MSLSIAVVGAGRMGKLHARVISEMPDAELAAVVDAQSAVAEAVARQRQCPHFSRAEDAVAVADAAIIAVPTVEHVRVAEPFVRAGKPVLIEKPLSNDSAQARKLLDLARQHGTAIHVGHTERFNPAVRAMQKHAIRPKFIEAHRISPFTFRSADVGVVLDMMIHDLDLVLKLAEGKVTEIRAVGINVIGPHEDICNARLVFDNGCVANVTASRLAIKTERKMRLLSEEAYLSVDYARKVGLVASKSHNLDLIQMARERNVEDLAELAETVDYAKLLHVEELTVDDSSEPLQGQARAFVDSIVNNAPPAVPAEDGLAALELAEQIVDSIKAHRWDGDASSRQGLDILSREG